MRDHRAPWWLPGGHLQTIWPRLFGRRDDRAVRLERTAWETPDGDTIAVDLQSPADAGAAAPMVVLLHGLEGSSASHYARAFAAEAVHRGWHFVLPHFRGCGGVASRAPRAYHSGDHAEVGWMLERAAEGHGGPLVACGISLGGNALLRWAEERGDRAGERVRAIAAVSAPLDLAAGATAIHRGLSRQVYTRYFLRTMKPKALAMLDRHPSLFDARRLAGARSLRAFDDAFTAPLHGFRDAADYYARASAGRELARIRVPALVLNARNDPFLPASALPRQDAVGPCVTLWQPAHGGHVGFATGGWPGRLRGLPSAVLDWLGDHATR